MNGEKDDIWADLTLYDLDDDEEHHRTLFGRSSRYRKE